jgi:hypothetical protein
VGSRAGVDVSGEEKCLASAAIRTLNMPASSESLYGICYPSGYATVLHQQCKQHVSSKSWCLSPKLHGVVFQISQSEISLSWETYRPIGPIHCNQNVKNICLSAVFFSFVIRLHSSALPLIIVYTHVCFL